MQDNNILSKNNYNLVNELITKANHITIVQAENPDGDSIASSLALDDIFSSLHKKTYLYCPVEIPKYLRYISGWDRIRIDLPNSTDLIVIVDTTADVLMSKIYDQINGLSFFNNHQVVVIDHHETVPNLRFRYNLINLKAVSTGQVIYEFINQDNQLIKDLSKDGANYLLESILSDSLGLTTQDVTANTFFIVGKLTEMGASTAQIEISRRNFMKKTQKILSYKADLIKRIVYYDDGRIAFIHIPWDEIKEYSDQYNPSVLVLDEMRLVKGVSVCIAIKTYPDGKLTGKIRSDLPIAAKIAEYFGGGGHDYAAGFRIYKDYNEIAPQIIRKIEEMINDYEANNKTV